MQCDNFLTENTYLLSCGHAFCEDHGKGLQRCLVCANPVSCILMNFSQKYIASNKKMRLVGFSPTEALESAAIAIEFWNFQKQFITQQSLRSLPSTTHTEKQVHYCELLSNYNVIKEKYESLHGAYTKLQNEQKNIIRPQETPLLFCPPSNQKLKNELFKGRRPSLNLFTPRN